MRILYLSHCLPYPPNKGDRIRAFYQLKHLARHHEVHLLALCREGATEVPEELASLCASAEVFPVPASGGKVRGALGLFSREPLTLNYFRSVALLKRSKQLRDRQRFDLVVAYTSAMVPYARALDDGTPWVLDMVDVDSAKWEMYSQFAAWPMRWVYGVEAKRMRRFESSLGDFSKILLTTSREVEDLQSFAPRLQAHAVRNGIRMEAFERFDVPRTEPPSLVFTGQMDYFANVDGVVCFAREVFPKLRRRFEGLEFVVVGRSPTARVLELEELPGVVVTGEVADVRPFLARATAFVAPLRIARGVQNKVLEAMASSLPVVCSREVGAGLSGGGFKSGRDLLIAANGNEFEAAVARVLEDKVLRSRLRDNAHRRVGAVYSLEATMEVFEGLLASAATGGLPAEEDSKRRGAERIA